jgi:Peptidase family M23
MQNLSQNDISRRQLVRNAAFIGIATGCAAGMPDAVGAVNDKLFEIVLRPTHVFKTADRSHETTESWIFSAIVQSSSSSVFTPTLMTVDLLKRGVLLRSSHYSETGLGPLTYHSSLTPLLADGSAPPTPIYWPFVVRLRNTEPITLGVDEMRIELVATDSGGRRGALTAVVPIETYHQKTALIFPFRGKGIILQGGATNGGHRNRSGSFAIDAFGLNDAWSIQVPGNGKTNADYLGWARPIIAPADGRIVRMRDDRPDQPIGDESNPKYYAEEFKKLGGGDPGNHLVIDHGDREFSMIAHFMAGSMRARDGDQVKQGQVLGKLGHSGDTTAPHVHYQLQSGPDWQNADGLPMKFVNVTEPFLDRGTYFEAK